MGTILVFLSFFNRSIICYCFYVLYVSCRIFRAYKHFSNLCTTRAGSAIASFRDLVTVARENSTNQTADALGLGQFSQEQEVHKANSRTECAWVICSAYNTACAVFTKF